MVRRAQSGSALIAVFWFMAILSLVVFSTIWVVDADMDSVYQQSMSFRALQLAEMGVAIGANPAVKEFDPILRQSVESEFGLEEGFSVRIRSEGGWMNINRMISGQDREFLERVFEEWGMEMTDAQSVVSSLIDWADQDEISTIPSLDGGAEKDFYEEQGFDNYPFQRPFYDIEEMALVRGMEIVAAYKPNWREYFTVFSEGGIDPNEASAEIIALAAEADPEFVDDLIQQRAGPDGIEDTEDDEPIQDVQGALAQIQSPATPEIVQRFSGSSNTVRIESTGIVGEFKKQIVLVIRNRNSRPVILLREEVPVN
ncbi:MAG: general secretion pathway protein K [Verrucomicrobiales bacterium]|jgi:general secretion pathway protein K